VLALAGTLGEGAQDVPGVDACHGILPAPMALAEALDRAGELLTDATERALRMIILGTRHPAPGTRHPAPAHAAGLGVTGAVTG
jgi:glycerate kinase